MKASLLVGALCGVAWLIFLITRSPRESRMPSLSFWLQRHARTRGDNGDRHDPLLTD